MSARLTLAFVAAMLLGGCASSLSGVGGTDRYACKAPEGAACMSVSGVYANSTHGVLHHENPPSKKSAPAAPASYGPSATAPSLVVRATDGASLRSPARVLKLWIAPWEDADGDLHEEGIVHVVVDTGRWLIEHVRPVMRPRMDAASPPAASAPDAPASPPSTPAPALMPPAPPTGFPLDAEPSTMER